MREKCNIQETETIIILHIMHMLSNFNSYDIACLLWHHITYLNRGYNVRTHANIHVFTFMYIKLALYSWPKAHHRAQSPLWETVFCCKTRMVLMRHRRALLTLPSLSLFLSLPLTHSLSTLCWFCANPPIVTTSPLFTHISIYIPFSTSFPC